MNTTPKTDKMLQYLGEPTIGGWVPASFAQELERELEANRETLGRENVEMRNLLRAAKCPACDGSGVLMEMRGTTECVSHDMALDAGDPSLEGTVYREPEPEPVQCEWCARRNAMFPAQF